ncbi:hypothetical protein ABDK56_11475 [Sphingomonas sp. ASV193]|uniref:hypothetical protein n=1 Tax=Sphingomonas sp. ASV193 TaxID=3144405 RepID=UPI0032E89B9D
MTRVPLILIAALVPAAASAQSYSTTEATPGSGAILSANYSGAAKALAQPSDGFDAGRAINLGIVMAKTGRADLAASQFNAVLAADEQTVTVASGHTASSYTVARDALAALSNGTLAR